MNKYLFNEESNKFIIKII